LNGVEQGLRGNFAEAVREKDEVAEAERVEGLKARADFWLEKPGGGLVEGETGDFREEFEVFIALEVEVKLVKFGSREGREW